MNELLNTDRRTARGLLARPVQPLVAGPECPKSVFLTFGWFLLLASG
jgi:hypothetical protein